MKCYPCARKGPPAPKVKGMLTSIHATSPKRTSGCITSIAAAGRKSSICDRGAKSSDRGGEVLEEFARRAYRFFLL